MGRSSWLRMAGMAAVLGMVGCETVDRARHAQREEADRMPGERTYRAEEVGLTNGVTVTLGQVERIALQVHPAVCQARQDVENARLSFQMIRSSRLPQITASGGYQRSTQNSAAARPYSATTSGSWSGSLGLDWLVYDFGKLNAQERQSFETLVAAEEKLRQSEIDRVYAVRSAFFESHRRKNLLRVAVENARQYRVHLDEAESMLEVGTRKKYDVTKAKVDWGNACLQVITASNQWVTARATLHQAVGLTDSPQMELAESVMRDTPEGKDVEGLMNLARENAPTLAVLRARVRAASAAVDEAIANLYPSVTAGAGLDLAGRSFPLVWNFSGLLRATQNLFDGKKNLRLIDQAVVALRTLRAQEAEEEQRLYKELVDAFAQWKSARESSEIAKLTWEQAKENLAIVEEQYRVGTSSSVERTDAQVSLTEAEANVVTAKYDEQDAQAKLANLVGFMDRAMEERK